MRIILIVAILLLATTSFGQSFDALGVAGAGINFDHNNEARFSAFGGFNVMLQSDTTLQMFNRTNYRYINNGPESAEVQALETYLVAKKYIYQGWSAALGFGPVVEIESSSDDATNLSMFAEVSKRVYAVDLFVGGSLITQNSGKSFKNIYVGLGLN